MNAARFLLYTVGAAMVVLALWMLFWATGLNQWVPIGVAAAGLLLIIGLLVMSSSSEVGHDTKDVEVVHEEHHRGGHAH